MRYRVIIFLLSVLLGAKPMVGWSQNIIFKHLSTDNGLSQVSVNSIYIDERGLIWVATRDGLNCYNGQEVQVYKVERDNPHSLPSSTVLRVIGDQKGHLYLLTSAGVAEFDIYTRQFRSLIHGKVDCIYFKDRLYISCKNELFVYNDKTGNFDSFYRVADMTGYVTGMFIDSKNLLWIGTEQDGVYTLSKDKTLKHRIEKLRVTQVYEDSRKNIWVGTWTNGIFQFSPNGQVFNIRHSDADPHSISSDFVRCFCEDNQGHIWVGTMNGLDLYYAEAGRFSCYVHNNQTPTSLSHSSVWCIQKDQQGTLWIGTYFGGVSYFNPEYQIYTIYRQSERADLGLSSPVVGNMVEDNHGSLWICTEGGGLDILDRHTGRFTWFTHSAAKNSISHDNVKSIYYDTKKDVMWIGTHLGGLNRLDLRTKQFTCFRHEEGNSETLPSDIIRDIVPYGDSLILATQDGMCMFSPQTGKCRQMFKNDKLGGLIKAVADMEFDRHGNLWLSVSSEGVFSYNLRTKKLTQYKYKEEEETHTISSNNVNSILCDSKGLIWFSTSGGGLDCYDPKTRRFTNYNMNNASLENNNIYKVWETGNQELILISTKSFAQFNYKTGKIKYYSVKNGFPFTAINENGLYVAKDRTVFLGGVDGMISFSLDKLNIAPKPYHLYWSKLTVNGQNINPGDDTGILPQALDVISKIRLHASQNMFSLYFASSNYLLENKEEMEYMLEGFSDKWTQTQGQPFITYTNLSPGTYTLRLRPVNPDSVCKEISLKIVILPPFYRTVWAYLFYILVIAGSVYYLMRMYKTRVKLRESLRYEQKHLQDIEKLNQSKLRFFTSISHEFRTPLTLIVGQLENVLQLPQVPPAIFSKTLTAYKSSLQLKGLINELLDFRKQEQGMMKLKVQERDLVQFLNETYLLFVAYAQQQQIKLSFEKPEGDITLWFDPMQMQKVINNLLSNAVKFCNSDGHITLSVYKEGEQACFSVEDDGVGIPDGEAERIFDRFYQASTGQDAQVGTGIGLALTKGIVELHHGTITVDTAVGKGTKFLVKLPMGKDAYTPEEIASSSDVKQSVVKENTISTVQANEMVPIMWKDSSATEGNESRPSILIVEDNDDIRRMLESLFSPIYRVDTAADGVEALEKIAVHLPQIVLSDVLMPRMSGIELTKQLKSNLDTCHIPIVLLTARTEVEHNLEGLRTGADDYITKPFDSRILVSRCNNLVNSRIQLQEYFSKQPTAQTPVLATNQIDQKFLDEVIAIFEKHLEDNEFTIDNLAQEMLISRTRVYGKIKAITGQTPNDFFVTLRLKRAAYLLRNNPELNIVAISERTGFSSARYFAKLFKKAYDVTPMEYRKS